MITNIIITVLFTISFLLTIYIAYLKLFKKHTREKFAFSALTNIMVLVTMFLMQVYSSNGFYKAIINVCGLNFEGGSGTNTTDWRDHVIVGLLIIFVIYYLFKMHQNWDGPISTIHADKKKFKEENSIYKEGYLQFVDFFRREKEIKRFIENENSYNLPIFSIKKYEKIPWFEDVYELFAYKSKHYNLDLDRDYYPEHNSFICDYGLNNEKIAILCSHQDPSEEEIDAFINFIFSQNPNYSRIIIATEKTQITERIINYSDNNIECFSKEKLLKEIVDWKNYKRYINKLFNETEVTPGNKLCLKDIYAPISGEVKNEAIESVEDYIIDWSKNEEESNKHLAILASYGCGKSVLSLKVTRDLINDDSSDIIPILIELRGMSPRNESIQRILAAWAADHRIEPFALLKLHKEGKLLIIFEGFDEMDMVGDRELRFLHFQKLWEFAHGKSKIIITGRPNFFLDDDELKKNLGISESMQHGPYCEAIHLNKLEKEKIPVVLRNVEKETREQVLDIISKNDANANNFYDLVSRPAILYLVSVIWKERNLYELKNNINSATVIDEFIKYTYSRQTEKETNFPLTSKERAFFMLGSAAGMHKFTGFSNLIDRLNLERIISILYNAFPEHIDPNDNATESIKNKLKIRLEGNPNANDMVFTDVRSCGLLVTDLAKSGYFKFAHKSFFDFLVSLFFSNTVASDIQSEDGKNSRIIMNALSIDNQEFKHSPDTINFTSEILINKINTLSNFPKEKYSVAKELFKLLYPNKILAKFPKFTLITNMLFDSLRTNLFFFMVPFMIFFYSYKIFFTEHTTLPSSSFILLVSMMTFVLASSIFIRKLRNSKKRSRIEIWLKCCERLNLNENEMRRFMSDETMEYYSNNHFSYLRFKLDKFRNSS